MYQAYGKVILLGEHLNMNKFMFSRSHGAFRPAPSAKPSGPPPLIARRLRRDAAFGRLGNLQSSSEAL